MGGCFACTCLCTTGVWYLKTLEEDVITLKLELQIVFVLGIKPESFERATSVLSHRAISSALTKQFYW